MMNDNDLVDVFRNEDCFKKLKIRYPDYDDVDLIFATFSIGLVATRNFLFSSLFEDILKNGLKD